ncbi:MAG: PAS domain-containing protein [Nitrosomonas sp.]|mgnify:FL=1|jgi:PAS domain S-box-containing protein|nr:MAG: PAS domain-containing protein [Nitrosomonas sp.]HMU63651.1 PAS domain-containing protein [Nitrosomonas sp.]HMV12716.1 PAS domain-containing protein [Nitrosomonas sp.]HMW20632.1 PAS domain-containing protein [Nitrosomonas sp.]HMW69608.1 PAS domain-containing protein [Nitrosomonas sp.]
MDFIVEKDPGLIPQVLSNILDSCVNGITLADPDQEDLPLVYANKAFETITGYTQAETIGKNCRFLQGNDRDQQERHQLREAVLNKQSIEITLRNYRKNGEMFYNHLVITPLFDSKGNVLYYLGVQFDVTQQKKAEEEIKRLTEQLAKLSK